MMWAFYLLEPVPHIEGLPLLEVLAYPLADGITIVSLGLLLGRFIGTDSEGEIEVRISSSYPALLAIPVFFTAGRILSYTAFHIYSSYAARQFDTIVWAATVGLWISIMYLFLFNLFMPLVFDYEIWPIGALLSYADLLIRASMDVLSVAVGVYVCEKIKLHS